MACSYDSIRISPIVWIGRCQAELTDFQRPSLSLSFSQAVSRSLLSSVLLLLPLCRFAALLPSEQVTRQHQRGRQEAKQRTRSPSCQELAASSNRSSLRDGRAWPVRGSRNRIQQKRAKKSFAENGGAARNRSTRWACH
eukprot:scaffold876_cov243-Pinguiococcus_pyrenoidosus.AAC.27